MSSVHFLFGVVLFLSCMSCVHSLGINPLLVALFENIFSHLCLIDAFLCCAEFLSWIVSHLLIFTLFILPPQGTS